MSISSTGPVPPAGPSAAAAAPKPVVDDAPVAGPTGAGAGPVAPDEAPPGVAPTAGQPDPTAPAPVGPGDAEAAAAAASAPPTPDTGAAAPPDAGKLGAIAMFGARAVHRASLVPEDMTRSSLLAGNAVNNALGHTNAAIAESFDALRPRGPMKLMGKLFAKIDTSIGTSAAQAKRATMVTWAPLSEGAEKIGLAFANPFAEFFAKRAGIELPTDAAEHTSALAKLIDPKRYDKPVEEAPVEEAPPVEQAPEAPAPEAPAEEKPAPAPDEGGEAPAPKPDEGGGEAPAPAPEGGGEQPAPAPEGGEGPAPAAPTPDADPAAPAAPAAPAPDADPAAPPADEQNAPQGQPGG